MGRGAAWTDVECAHLSEAWLVVSQDPIIGMDQTCLMFYTKVFELFKTKKPASATDKQYDARGVKATRSKWEAISADVQKFRVARRELRAFRPTGTNEDQNLSMTIARHLNKAGCITYDAKNLPHEDWVHHLAFKVLKDLPKFRDDIDETSSPSTMPSEPATPNTETTNENATGDENDERNRSEGESARIPSRSPAIKRKHESNGFVGRKKAKSEMVRNRQNEAAIRNAASIAASMKRRTDLLEEQNALIAFSASECITEEDEKDRDEFMKLTRRMHLKRLRESLSATEEPPPPPTPAAQPLDADDAPPVPNNEAAP